MKHPADRPWWHELWAWLILEYPTREQRRRLYDLNKHKGPWNK